MKTTPDPRHLEEGRPAGRVAANPTPKAVRASAARHESCVRDRHPGKDRSHPYASLHQPQSELPMMAFVPLDEILDRSGRVPHLKIAALSQLICYLFGD